MAEPVWDGTGTDPWMPQRLAAQAQAVVGERTVFDDYLARLSRWLVAASRAVLKSLVVDPDAIWSLMPAWAESMTEFVHTVIADLIGAAYRKLLGPGYLYSQQPHVTAYLAEAQNRLVGVPNQVYDLIVEQIAEGAGMGEGIEGIRKRVQNTFSLTDTPYWPNRAVVVARTECLLGDTQVESDGIQAVYRRWYEGPVFRVHMASGYEFTGTANHPVLTPSGWFALGELQPGDELVRHDGGQNLRARGDVHVGDMPATLGEVYDALAAVGVRIRARAGQPDFHGDGMDGHVDIAVANRELADRVEAALGQHLGDFGFKTPHNRPSELLGGGRLASVDGVSPLAQDAERLQPSLDGARVQTVFGRQVAEGSAVQILSRHLVDIELELVRMVEAELAIAGAQGVAGLASGHSSVLQDALYNSVVHPQSPGERQLAVPSQIFSDDGVSVQIQPAQSGGFGLGARRYPRVGEYGADPSCVDAQALLDAVDALTRPVGVDQIVRVDRLEFVGHVYNLSTERGWFGVGPFYSGNTMGAMNAGRAGAFRAVAEELGQPFDKSWLATMAGPAAATTRPTHRAADGQRVPVDGLFRVGESLMDRPGDPSAPANEVISCRCSMLLLKPGESVDLSNRQFLDY